MKVAVRLGRCLSVILMLSGADIGAARGDDNRMTQKPEIAPSVTTARRQPPIRPRPAMRSIC